MDYREWMTVLYSRRLFLGMHSFCSLIQVHVVSHESSTQGDAWRFGAIIRAPLSFELGNFLYFASSFMMWKDAFVFCDFCLGSKRRYVLHKSPSSSSFSFFPAYYFTMQVVCKRVVQKRRFCRVLKASHCPSFLFMPKVCFSSSLFHFLWHLWFCNHDDMVLRCSMRLPTTLVLLFSRRWGVTAPNFSSCPPFSGDLNPLVREPP